MMKYLLKLSLCLLGVSISTACSKSEDPDNPDNFPNKGQLQVKATLYSAETGSGFEVGKQIGMFVWKNAADLDKEQADYINVGCTSQLPDQYWLLSEPVQLKNEGAIVFAYYPFMNSVNNPKKIPVDITRMQDICFGVNNQQSMLNRQQPIALITMRHALTKIRFNLIRDKNEEYAGPGIIETARVVKLKGDGTIDEDRLSVLTIEGFLDATTGQITTSRSGKMPIEALANKVFTFEGIENEKQPFFFSCPESDMKDFAFAIIIDGKQHLLPIQDGTEWKAATINTYTFRLKGEELTIVQDGTNGFTIKPWEDVEKEFEY